MNISMFGSITWSLLRGTVNYLIIIFFNFDINIMPVK